MRYLRILIVGVLFPATPALAVDNYDDCLRLVEQSPERAEAEAHDWGLAGGGAAAGHCRALALMAQGADRRAAALLIDIATEDRTLPDSVRAELLVDAGQIFLGLGDLKQGEEAAARAGLLVGEKQGPLALSARIKAERGDWQGAVGDLDKALATGEPDAELLTLRASAKLKLGRQVAARDDLLWATEIAPNSPTVWLERGALEEAAGNREGARAAWLKAIELDSEGIVTEAARLRIQRMEAGN